KPVVEQGNAGLGKRAPLPECRARIEDTGGQVVTTTLPQASDYLNAEFTRWAKVVKERNIKAD
ncbi:hypothetical protein NS331_22190, partial [Pseudacidovorax intermedius]